MKVVIVGGGDPPSSELIRRYYGPLDVLIAADSGADVLYKYEIKPDYLLGDFDSIDVSVYESIRNNMDVTTLPREKDFTDTHVAFLKAVAMGAEEIVLLGCTGKRIDHFMANLSILYKGLEKNIRVYMVDEYNEMFMTDSSIRLKGKAGDVFSVFAYGEDVEGLSFIGAKYPLTDYYLATTDNLTVSNEFLDDEVEVNFRKGCLLIILNIN